MIVIRTNNKINKRNIRIFTGVKINKGKRNKT